MPSTRPSSPSCSARDSSEFGRLPSPPPPRPGGLLPAENPIPPLRLCDFRNRRISPIAGVGSPSPRPRESAASGLFTGLCDPIGPCKPSSASVVRVRSGDSDSSAARFRMNFLLFAGWNDGVSWTSIASVLNTKPKMSCRLERSCLEKAERCCKYLVSNSKLLPRATHVTLQVLSRVNYYPSS